MAIKTVPLPNADATVDENETMPLIFSCKQRRAAKLNQRRAGYGLNMSEHPNNIDYEIEAEMTGTTLMTQGKAKELS